MNSGLREFFLEYDSGFALRVVKALNRMQKVQTSGVCATPLSCPHPPAAFYAKSLANSPSVFMPCSISSDHTVPQDMRT